MNIAQLLHNQHITQSISHWPVFIVNELRSSWYFYSVKGLTLRKKPQNTSIVGFLSSHLHINPQNKQYEKGQNEKQSKYTILQVRQIDRRQPKDTELHTIKIKKLLLSDILPDVSKSGQNIIRDQEWKPNLNQQISLYKIENIQQNKLYNLLWSQNIITCKAPITSNLQQRLTKYAETICQKAQQKYLKNLAHIRQFEIVFTYNSKNGKIKIVCAHNFKLSPNPTPPGAKQRESTINIGSTDLLIQNNKILKAREMYWTDLKIGQDDYEYIELMMQQQTNNIRQNKPKLQIRNPKTQQQHPNIKILQQMVKINQEPCQKQLQQTEQDRIQQKRLKYIKCLQKLHNQENQFTHKLNVAMKKQARVDEVKEFQCSACRSCVRLEEFEPQKMVSSHRIPEIQILRQVKMRANNIGIYQLVPVCQLCYNKFKQIVQNKPSISRGILRNNSNKTSSRQQPLTIPMASESRKPYLNPTKQPQIKRASVSVSNYTKQKNGTSMTKNTNKQVGQPGLQNRIGTPSLDANSLENRDLDDYKYGFLVDKAKKRQGFRKCSLTHNNINDITQNQQKAIGHNINTNKISLSRSINRNKKTVSNYVSFETNAIIQKQKQKINQITHNQRQKQKSQLEPQLKQSTENDTNDQFRNALFEYEYQHNQQPTLISGNKQKATDNINNLLSRINSRKYQICKHKLGKFL